MIEGIIVIALWILSLVAVYVKGRVDGRRAAAKERNQGWPWWNRPAI